MTPQECINTIEQECPNVFFWEESYESFPTKAQGFFEDGSTFIFTVIGSKAELIMGEYDPESHDYAPVHEFMSIQNDCNCKDMKEYVDIFLSLVYALDKSVNNLQEEKEMM